jgi:uncharacterized hydrophobic protein (TIGR00271 family)
MVPPRHLIERTTPEDIMRLAVWLRQTQWTLQRHWFGVWEVRNYYTTLEQRAVAGARVTLGYGLMVVVAAVLATAGLLLDSPTVVIGAMCIAPFLGPSRAVCIGALFGSRRTFWRGLAKQLAGLLIVGAGVAALLTALLQITVPDIGLTGEILARAMPTARHAVLSVLIAVAAGAAASLSLSADPRIVETPWGQVVDAVIGVEIAISLIPPAAVAGIGLALGDLMISRNALLLLLVNVVGLDLVGSTLMLALRGVRGRYLVLEKQVRQAAQLAAARNHGVTLVDSRVDVTLLGEAEAQVLVRIRGTEAREVPAGLPPSIVDAIHERTGCRSEVTVELIPSLTHSNF